MKLLLPLSALPLAAALLLAAPAGAQTFDASLSGAQEPSFSPATGTGSVTLDAGGPTGERLFVSSSVSGLSTPLTMYHIHGPAVPGYQGPVLYTIADAAMNFDPLGILGKTSFSFTNFEIDLPATVQAADLTFTQAQQVTFLESSLDYLNAHTTKYKDGEIRGQLFPAAVPEAGTAVSFGLPLALALGGLAVARRRAKGAA
jgi:hypothetical protein